MRVFSKSAAGPVVLTTELLFRLLFRSRSCTASAMAARLVPCAACLLAVWRVAVAQDRTLERATFATGEWHGAEARWGCVRGVARTRVGHVSLLGASPKAGEARNIGDAVEAVRLEYDVALTSYATLLERYWEILGEPTQVRKGPLGPEQYAHAILYHTQAQADAAQASLAQARSRHGARVATKVLPYVDFVTAPRAEQKTELQRRDDTARAFAKNITNKRWMLFSDAATRVNSFLLGGCSPMYRDWQEVEAEIEALHLSLEELSSIGLEHLFPGIVMVPLFGDKEQKEYREAQSVQVELEAMQRDAAERGESRTAPPLREPEEVARQWEDATVRHTRVLLAEREAAEARGALETLELFEEYRRNDTGERAALDDALRRARERDAKAAEELRNAHDEL